MFTIGSIEEQARGILLDTNEDAYRFEPKEMFYAIHDAMKQSRSARPECRYVNGFLTDRLIMINGHEADFTIPTSLTEETLADIRSYVVNMEDQWREALVFYTVYRMYLKDDPDTANAELAKSYLAQYSSSINS